MLRSFSICIMTQLFKHCDLPSNKAEVYVYGAELMLSTLAGCISVLIFSGLLHSFISGITFLAIFVSLRLFTGGYHAKTYARCFITSNSVFIILMATSYMLERIGAQYLCFAVLLIADFTIFFFTPIRNYHHPLSDTSYKKNKRISRELVLGETSIILLLFLLTRDTSFFSVASLSFAAVAVMMIIPKKLERR